MKPIRVAAGVLNQTPLAWERNRANILGAIADARAQHATILCLPEMCLTGYGCEDAFQSPGLQERAMEALLALAPETRGMIVGIGLPVLFRNALFNAAALLVDGQLAGFVAKRFLAGDGIHYEPRWFKPWQQGIRGTVRVDGADVPIGDLYFDCGGIKIGFEICEDAWVATRPGGWMAAKGVDVLLNPSASHFAFGKIAVRRRFVVEGSRAFGVSYIYTNLLGNEAGRAIYDGGSLIASAGRLIAEGPRLSFRDHVVTAATIDVDATRMNQVRTASFKPDLAPDGDTCVRVPFAWPEVRPGIFGPPPLPEWESSPRLKEEEFARATALALGDYLRKTHASGFAVSLSGGADSSACAALVALFVRIAVAELGLDRFCDKFLPRAVAAGVDSEAEVIRRILLCVYQSTANSGPVTRHASETVAKAVGAEYLTLEVGPIVEAYTRIVAEAVGRPITWERDDLALQNVQARTRGPAVWMLANLRGAILLTTSNRSEAAVGYATMDGDTCGGLAPVSGIDKKFLLDWLRWLEREGPHGHGAIPELHCVTVQPPTAELRPPEAAQTDEADLMPYRILDLIERFAIRDKQMPVEVLRTLESHVPEEPLTQLAAWVERFFRLWCRNQWKRERYAPGFHVDDESLDPRTWCRFPILNGGYELELEEMRAYVQRRGEG